MHTGLVQKQSRLKLSTSQSQRSVFYVCSAGVPVPKLPVRNRYMYGLKFKISLAAAAYTPYDIYGSILCKNNHDKSFSSAGESCEKISNAFSHTGGAAGRGDRVAARRQRQHVGDLGEVRVGGVEEPVKVELAMAKLILRNQPAATRKTVGVRVMSRV